MGARSRNVEAIIHAIYEASLERGRWADAVAEIRSTFEVAACGLTWRRPDGVSQVWSGLPPSFERDYVSHFHAQDPWIEAASDLPVGRCMIGPEVIPVETLVRTQFYADLLRPHHLLDLYGAYVDRVRGLDISFSLMPHAGRRRDPRTIAASIETLLPHVRRAERIARRVNAADQVEASLFDRLDSAAIAGFLVDATGAVRSQNTRADALLRTGEHVRIVGRRLDATHASARKPLQALIHAALRVDAGTQPPVAPVLVTPRSASSQPVPLLVTATPLRGPAASRFHGSEDPCALVLAMIPGTGTATPSLGSALEAAYGLSPAQARVAALVGTGQSPRDAAARLGLTEGTVRFQLKQIYGKLAVDGQRGLVAISTALALFLPAPRARAAD